LASADLLLEFQPMLTVLPIVIFLAAVLVLNKTQTGHFF
jgi:hypothetical protein